MADEPEHISLKVVAINTDHTNRHENVNSTKKLSDEITRIIPTMFRTPEFVTLTEVSAKGSITGVKEKLGKIGYQSDFHTFGNSSYHDSTVLLWDASKWKSTNPKRKHGTVVRGTTVFSHYGKYVGVILEEVVKGKKDPKRVMHTAVHWPTKDKKQLKSCNELLSKLFEESLLQYDLDAVVVSGDFNTPTGKLSSTYDTVVFTEDHGPTTATGKFIDNVLSNGNCEWESQHVHSTYGIFSHFPISAKTKLEN